MLSNKEIIEKFDIPKSTLYGWIAERPKVYDYLANSDEQYEKYREINIFLETYIKTSKSTPAFEYKEIEYIFSLELRLGNLKEIENLHLTYVNTSIKSEKESSEFTLNIYKKLELFNLIEKYIFASRLKTLGQRVKGKKEEREELLRHYFKEFLSA